MFTKKEAKQTTISPLLKKNEKPSLSNTKSNISSAHKKKEAKPIPPDTPFVNEIATEKTDTFYDKSMKSIELQGIKCTLSDKNKTHIQIGLKFYFTTQDLESEILFKRDNIKMVIKSLLKNKKLTDIVIDTLRKELLIDINKLLKKGTIEDIEFFDFRPIESL